jgi:plasmid maintenance system antidote protein VapI
VRHVALQTTMRKKFLEYQGKNESFSVRALAKKLGMQPGATNEILKGERRVSRRIAERIAERLMLDPTERQDLLKEFPEKMKRNYKNLPSKK